MRSVETKGAHGMQYQATDHFWQRARERQLLSRYADIIEAVKQGRKIPQRNNRGEILADVFAHIGEQITVIAQVTEQTTNLITIYETRGI